MIAVWTEAQFADAITNVKQLIAAVGTVVAAVAGLAVYVFGQLKEIKGTSDRNTTAIGKVADRMTTVALAMPPVPPTPTPEKIIQAIEAEGTKS